LALILLFLLSAVTLGADEGEHRGAKYVVLVVWDGMRPQKQKHCAHLASSHLKNGANT
jgi:hypothetical protein